MRRDVRQAKDKRLDYNSSFYINEGSCSTEQRDNNRLACRSVTISLPMPAQAGLIASICSANVPRFSLSPPTYSVRVLFLASMPALKHPHFFFHFNVFYRLDGGAGSILWLLHLLHYTEPSPLLLDVSATDGPLRPDQQLSTAWKAETGGGADTFPCSRCAHRPASITPHDSCHQICRKE